MLDSAVVTTVAEKLGLTVWPSFIESVRTLAKLVYLLGGWRAGKSLRAAFIVFLQIFLVWLRREGAHLVWIIGPDYEQARPEYFYIARWAAQLGLDVQASAATQGSLRMTIGWRGKPGQVEVVTKSASDPTSLGGVAPVIILVCEAGQIPEEAKMWIDGRTAEKNATVIYDGTFENEEGKAQFAWFEVEGGEVLYHPELHPRAQAFQLPTWENMYLYGDCRAMIADDASLESWCPDGEHGPLHSGLDHPMMRQLKDKWRDKPRDWDKRFGGIPQGVRNPVYEWSLRDSLTDFSQNRYLVPMPDAMRDPAYRWLTAAGGQDFGTVHPSAICVGKMTPQGEIWVVEAPQDTSARLDWVWTTQQTLSRKHRIPAHMWGRDPMVKYVPSYVPGDAMSGSLYAREARVGICNSAADSGKLRFDARNPEVVVLFGQIQRIHRKRQANGQLVYVRDEDDGPAAWEDMMAMLLGQPVLDLPRKWTLPAYRRRPAMTMRSVS